MIPLFPLRMGGTRRQRVDENFATDLYIKRVLDTNKKVIDCSREKLRWLRAREYLGVK